MSCIGAIKLSDEVIRCRKSTYLIEKAEASGKWRLKLESYNSKHP